MPPTRIKDPQAEILILTESDWLPCLVAALNGAQTSILVSIYMISPYWRGPGWTAINLVNELCRHPARGLACRALLDRPNVPYKVHPFNIQAARTMHQAGWKIRIFPDARTLHEKVVIIDHHISIVGSHNFSRASATSNYDTSLIVKSTPLASALTRQFWTRWRLGQTLKD